MFTGIIENTATVSEIVQKGSNKIFWLNSNLSPELKVDQSVSHNGVCLTVEEINGLNYRVTAVEETLQKTNLGKWQPGTIINLERSMQMNGRLDGHIVQGHVDCIGFCRKIIEKAGSHELHFEIGKKHSQLIIEKGSIAVNGISLTIYDITDSTFCVAVIPYTFQQTNIHQLKVNDTVNIEFDVIGKYVARLSSLTQ